MKKEKVRIKTINMSRCFISIFFMVICLFFLGIGVLSMDLCEHWSCAISGYMVIMVSLGGTILCILSILTEGWDEYEVYGRRVG